MPAPSNHCIFEYLYRDAGNYKARRRILLAGRTTEVLQSTIKAALIDGLYFIPQHVGLPALQGELYALSNGPTEDDHAWHEFVGLYDANESEVRELPVLSSVALLTGHFRNLRGRG